MSQPITGVDGGLRLFEFGQSVLAKLELAALEDLRDIPKKRYVTSGNATWDCEQVVVTVLSVNTGLPGGSGGPVPQSMVCAPMWSVALDMTIIRCGPKITSKGTMSADSLNKSFESSSRDVEVLMRTVDKMVTDPDNFGNVLAQVTVMEPQGDMIGTTARITAGLP